MDLINKKQDILLFSHLINDITDTFLKLASVFTSGYHSGKIQNHYSFILHSIRDHSGNDPLCKTFYNSSFTDSRLSRQTWIILGPSA